MNHSQGVKSAAAWLPLATMMFVAAAGCNKQTQHAPDVWAVVNGKEIKREEVDKYYRTRVNPEGQEPSQEESLSQKLNVLDELINNEILLEKAKKLNLEASDGEVEDKFTELKSPYTEDEFQRRLKGQDADGPAEQRRGLCAIGDGLFRRYEHSGNRRRLGLRSRIGAKPVRPDVEKGRGCIEGRASKPADCGSAERRPAHPDPEAHRARIPRPARHIRTASAANHPRYTAQPQGTIIAPGLSGDRAGWGARGELPGGAGLRRGLPP